MPRVIRAKLHGLRVTMSDLHYHGSITLDPEHCDAAGIYPTEFVDVWNKNSGARLSTYVIFGQPGFFGNISFFFGSRGLSFSACLGRSPPNLTPPYLINWPRNRYVRILVGHGVVPVPRPLSALSLG